jgi:hypothetical protein
MKGRNKAVKCTFGSLRLLSIIFFLHARKFLYLLYSTKKKKKNTKYQAKLLGVKVQLLHSNKAVLLLVLFLLTASRRHTPLFHRSFGENTPFLPSTERNYQAPFIVA